MFDLVERVGILFADSDKKQELKTKIGLKQLKKHSAKNNLRTYTATVDQYPTFRDEVETFIEKRAKRDLAQTQFSEKQDDTVENLVEVGGILGYNGQLEEIDYSGPGQVYILVTSSLTGEFSIPLEVWRANPPPKDLGIFPKKVFAMTELKIEESCDFTRLNSIINWHTHPQGNYLPSKVDTAAFDSLNSICTPTPTYSVIFTPMNGKFSWYQQKPLLS